MKATLGEVIVSLTYIDGTFRYLGGTLEEIEYFDSVLSRLKAKANLDAAKLLFVLEHFDFDEGVFGINFRQRLVVLNSWLVSGTRAEDIDDLLIDVRSWLKRLEELSNDSENSTAHQNAQFYRFFLRNYFKVHEDDVFEYLDLAFEDLFQSRAQDLEYSLPSIHARFAAEYDGSIETTHNLRDFFWSTWQKYRALERIRATRTATFESNRAGGIEGILDIQWRLYGAER